MRQPHWTLIALLLLTGCRSANGGVIHLRKSQQEEDSRRNSGSKSAAKSPAGPTIYFSDSVDMRNERSLCRLRNTHFANGSAFVAPIRENLEKSGYVVTTSRKSFDLEARASGIIRDCQSDVDGDVTLEIIRDDSVVERSTKRIGTQNEWQVGAALVADIKGSSRVASALKGKVVAIAPAQPAPVVAAASTSSASAKSPPYVDNTPMAVNDATSMLVVPLKCVRGVAKDTCPLITNYMMSQFQSVRNLRTVGQDDINAVLGVDKQKQAIGCSDVSCMAEIGGALGVDLVMYGELGVLGTKYNINVSAVRTGNASVAARASLRCDKTEDALADNLPTLVRDVVNGINEAPATAAQ